VVMGMSRLLRVLQVPPFSPAARVATTLMVGLSSSNVGGVELPAKEAHPWSFLPVFSRYGVVHRFTQLPFFLFLL
jgi:hypothetical protein